jgi:hypothetical protein
VELAADAAPSRCNCTVCTKTAVTASIVKPEAFTLLAGEENLSFYEWGPKFSKRYFCKTCGVHCFGRGHLPDIGGDFVSVSWQCFDDVDLAAVTITYWDGRNNNWEGGARLTPWPIAAASAARTG